MIRIILYAPLCRVQRQSRLLAYWQYARMAAPWGFIGLSELYLVMAVGVTHQQQPGSYQGVEMMMMMMMKAFFWWRKAEYPEEASDLYLFLRSSHSQHI